MFILILLGIGVAIVLFFTSAPPKKKPLPPLTASQLEAQRRMAEAAELAAQAVASAEAEAQEVMDAIEKIPLEAWEAKDYGKEFWVSWNNANIQLCSREDYCSLAIDNAFRMVDKMVGKPRLNGSAGARLYAYHNTLQCHFVMEQQKRSRQRTEDSRLAAKNAVGKLLQKRD